MALSNGDSILSFKDFKWEADELGHGRKEYPKFIRLTCEFKSQYFHGVYRFAVTNNTLNSFISDLEKIYATLKGTAQIFDFEEHVECRISPTKQGHIEVSGYIRTYSLTNQMLFAFVSDQTFLPEFIRGLKIELDQLKST